MSVSISISRPDLFCQSVDLALIPSPLAVAIAWFTIFLASGTSILPILESLSTPSTRNCQSLIPSLVYMWQGSDEGLSVV